MTSTVTINVEHTHTYEEYRELNLDPWRVKPGDVITGTIDTWTRYPRTVYYEVLNIEKVHRYENNEWLLWYIEKPGPTISHPNGEPRYWAKIVPYGERVLIYRK